MGLKHDEELKRLQRLVVACFLTVLVGVIGLVAFMSYLAKDIQLRNENYIDLKIKGIKVTNGRDGLSIEGQVGPQGLQGIQGVQGAQGPAGVQGVAGPQGERGEQGEPGVTGNQGPQGEPGEPGKTVYQRTNPLTGEEECRYYGDREWMPATECEA